MSPHKISIILVNWNNVIDTIECLESIIKITYPNYEVIVVDNGSEGDDVKIIDDKFGSHIRLIANGKNDGFAEGCNIGMRDALSRDADYIVLLNNDTIVDPDILKELVDVVESDKMIGIVGGKIYCYEFPDMIWFAGGNLNYWTGHTQLIGSGETDNGQFEEIAEVDWICGCFMFIKRDLLSRIGMLDKNLFFGWEDVDFCLRARKMDYKIVYTPKSKIWHKAFPESKKIHSSGMRLYHATKGHFLFMEKNFTKLQFISSTMHFLLVLPKTFWTYSKVFKDWKISLYILRGILAYIFKRVFVVVKGLFSMKS